MDPQQEQEEEEEQHTPPNHHHPDPNPITIYTYPKFKRRKQHGSKRRRTQIHLKPKEPHPNSTQLVLYDKSKSRSTQKRVVVNVYGNSETKSSAMERAEEIRGNLDAEFPSFAKALVRSNVTVGFWMHLPMRFCKMHLPKNDATVFLENEHGVEFITNFIAERTALSGGWKAFIGAHGLNEGDILIFHLVKPLKFKVYIVRGNDPATVDSDFGVQNLGTRENTFNSDDEAETDNKDENVELLPMDLLDGNNQENGLMVSDANKEHEVDNEGEGCGGESLQVIAFVGSTVEFEDVKCIDNFSILVNGLAIDSELSDYYRTKYFELCCSQNSFLHENLLNSINNKLAAEIISGTVNIAESIRASKLSSSHADYAVWDKTLKGFELLGMNVGFLRARLERVMTLATESEKAVESECREVRLEQDRVSEEMQALEIKLQALKEARERLDDEIENLKSDAERHEHMFWEAINAPW